MNRSESKYFNTARRMAEALLSLLAEKDLAFITVKELCQRAGVNRSTFYLHYETVNDLLEETVALVHQRFQDSIPPAGADAVPIETAPTEALFFMTDHYLLPYLNFVRENRRVYKAIHHQTGPFGAEQAYQQFFRQIFSPVLTRFGVAQEQHGYIMSFYRHGLAAVLMQWVEGDCQESPAQIAQIIQLCVGQGS